jgi:hypothetical protein
METAEEIAAAGMEAAAGEIETLCLRLLALHDCLPVTAQESDLEDLSQDTPSATVKRSAIQNVVTNFLRPAAEDLRAAATYKRPPAWRTWDLSVYSKEMERRLYDFVAEQSFGARGGPNPDDTWVPQATPEQAQLRVWFEYGRWWAAFRKLNVPESAPEEERWEVLRLDENEQKPGTLFTQEI